MSNDPRNPSESPVRGTYPDALERLERHFFYGNVDKDDPAIEQRRRVGVAFSGGGVRSATFCLGVLQALAAKIPLERIGYLSTVSGGGYVGGMLSALFAREKFAFDADVPGQRAEQIRAQLKDTRGPLLSWLRENGRYLAPRGSGDMLYALALVLRNWISVFLGFFAAAFALYGSAEIARWMALCLNEKSTHPIIHQVLTPGDAGSPRYTSPLLYLALLLLLAVAVPYGASYWAVPPDRFAHRWRRWFGARLPLVMALPAAALAAMLVAVFAPHWQGPNSWEFVGITLVVTPVLASQTWRCLAAPGLPRVRLFAAFAAMIALGSACFIGADEWSGYEERLLASIRQLVASALPAAPAPDASAAHACCRPGDGGDGPGMLFQALHMALLGVLAFCITGAWAMLLARHANRLRRPCDGNGYEASNLRHWMTDTFARVLMIAAVIAFLGLVDTAGAWLYVQAGAATYAAGGVLAAVMTLASNAVKLAQRLGPARGQNRVSLPLNVLAGLAGIALMLMLLAGVDCAAHMAALGFATDPDSWTAATRGFTCAPLFAITAACLIGTLVYGRFFQDFVNSSSYHNLYKSRIVRTYLGASNPLRQGTLGDPESIERAAVSDPTPDDDLRYRDLDGKCEPQVARLRAAKAPLHIVNICLNETVSSVSGLQQQDRKGHNLAYSPVAITAPPCSTRLGTLQALRSSIRILRWNEGAEPVLKDLLDGLRKEADLAPVGNDYLEPAELSLGTQVAVSGAAFSTGMGFQTSVGLSLLMGILNLRTGYWWNSGTRFEATGSGLRHFFSKWLPVHTQLFDEWTARYFGTLQTWWNLSDGGHFENLGAYELIRRRLASIVVVDADADPNCQFADLANLMRKARLDFGAEIVFVDPNKKLEADSPYYDPAQDRTHLDVAAEAIGLSGRAGEYIGQLSDLSLRDKSGASTTFAVAHAAIARIDYAGGTRGWLLYIKPTVTRDVSEDILNYRTAHAEFPNETTADQFFDEGQWESYRRLGEAIGERLFDQHLFAT